MRLAGDAVAVHILALAALARFVGGGFGHFFNYAPFKIEYAINRYAMETKRQLHVLDTHLAKNEYLAGEDYTIADWPPSPGTAT